MVRDDRTVWEIFLGNVIPPALLGGIGYLVTGRLEIVAVLVIVGLIYAFQQDENRRLAARVTLLERRMLEAEEQKASVEWVARLQEAQEQDRGYLERQLDRVQESASRSY